MKKIINILLCLIILLGVSGCGKVKYTDNMLKVREDFNPWNLEVSENVGDLLDKALEKAKWSDKNNIVKVKGKDQKTGKDVEVTFTIKDEQVTFDKMVLDGKETDYIGFFEYIADYAD